MHNDFYYDNDSYAKIGCLQMEELNMLEMELLEKLDFKVWIEEDEYRKYVNECSKMAAEELKGRRNAGNIKE